MNDDEFSFCFAIMKCLYISAYVTKENSIDFISIMLAKPNCLVALALYHNDFPKANQILEVSVHLNNLFSRLKSCFYIVLII